MQSTRNPWLDLACTMIRHASNGLTNQSGMNDASARLTGFENAEHEALAFLGSDLFDALVDAVLAQQAGKPGERSPDEYVQDVIQRAYGGAVEVVTDAPGVGQTIPHRGGERPGGRGYVDPLSETSPAGTFLLDEYTQIIQAEQDTPDVLVIELPGLSLMEDVSLEPTTTVRNS